MSIETVLNVLSNTGIPIRHIEFTEEQTPPYMIYIETREDTVYADGKKAYGVTEYDIELYRNPADRESENAVDNALDGTGVTYDKSYNYLSDLKLLEVIYTFAE